MFLDFNKTENIVAVTSTDPLTFSYGCFKDAAGFSHGNDFFQLANQCEHLLKLSQLKTNKNVPFKSNNKVVQLDRK